MLYLTHTAIHAQPHNRQLFNNKIIKKYAKRLYHHDLRTCPIYRTYLPIINNHTIICITSHTPETTAHTP